MKKILKAMFIAAMLAACTITAHAASSELEGYPITVKDWDTPAVFAGEKEWPITTWYLYAEDGEVLGSIPAHVVSDLAQSDPTGSRQWEFWLADAFNDYRQMNGPAQEAENIIQKPEPVKPQQAPKPANPKAEQPEEQVPVIEAAPPTAEPEQSDANALALEAFDLINEARAANGLYEVTMSEDAMELAKMRVPELEQRYEHTRPDGTRMSRTYYCGEIINRRASTAQIAVESWLGSPGHREMILAERYHSAGIACWQGADGVTYWCMLFYR